MRLTVRRWKGVGWNWSDSKQMSKYPDSCFVEDAAVIARSFVHGADSGRGDLRDEPRHAILTRPGAPSRQGEVVSMRSELVRLFPSVCEIRSPGTLEGGDVCEAGAHFFIGPQMKPVRESWLGY